jgi:hypothetical protein
MVMVVVVWIVGAMAALIALMCLWAIYLTYLRSNEESGSLRWMYGILGGMMGFLSLGLFWTLNL